MTLVSCIFKMAEGINYTVGFLSFSKHITPTVWANFANPYWIPPGHFDPAIKALVSFSPTRNYVQNNSNQKEEYCQYSAHNYHRNNIGWSGISKQEVC